VTDRPMPRRAAPALELRTLDGGTWRLAERKPKSFTMIVFYRGLHCPICSRYIKDLDNRLADLAGRGVEAIAASSDGAERAAEARERWKLEQVTVGHGLTIAAARSWGLYVSSGRGKTSIGIEEPAEFSEPGLFLVRPDGTIYYAAVQSMPFARPSFSELVGAIDFVLAKDYPARGELAG
jgi:peroxiredoxin